MDSFYVRCLDFCGCCVSGIVMVGYFPQIFELPSFAKIPSVVDCRIRLYVRRFCLVSMLHIRIKALTIGNMSDYFK